MAYAEESHGDDVTTGSSYTEYLASNGKAFHSTDSESHSSESKSSSHSSESKSSSHSSESKSTPEWTFFGLENLFR